MYQRLQKPFLIFGAGKRGRCIVDTFPDAQCVGFIDNNSCDLEYRGIPILSLDEARKKWTDILYIVSPLFGYEEIKEQLEKAGVHSQYIFVIESYNRKLAEKIYIDSSYIPYSRMRVYADCGGYNGDDTKKFLELNASKVHLFEPDTDMYEACLNRFRKENDVVLHSEGLYSKKGQCKFESIPGGGMSNIVPSGLHFISVNALDNLVEDKINFLKMDIEGSEWEALSGAKNIILENRPKMAISVYHKEEDIWRIPLKILEYDATYQFEFKHYSLGQVDTVLYAF